MCIWVNLLYDLEWQISFKILLVTPAKVVFISEIWFFRTFFSRQGAHWQVNLFSCCKFPYLTQCVYKNVCSTVLQRNGHLFIWCRQTCTRSAKYIMNKHFWEYYASFWNFQYYTLIICDNGSSLLGTFYFTGIWQKKSNTNLANWRERKTIQIFGSYQTIHSWLRGSMGLKSGQN